MILAGLLVLSVALRIQGLAPTSLYRDDAWSMLVTRMHGLGEIRLVMMTAPGFELVLKMLGAIFGNSSLAAQAPAWIAGIALAPLSFVVAESRRFVVARSQCRVECSSSPGRHRHLARESRASRTLHQLNSKPQRERRAARGCQRQPDESPGNP